jgi:hypothetical protein
MAGGREADDVPLPADIGELQQALEVRRRLMEKGAIRQAKEFMRRWYKIHRKDKDNS